MATPYYTKLETDAKVEQGIGSKRTVENRYESGATDWTDCIADQANQKRGNIQYVDDASGHPDIDSGFAYFEYLGTTNGDETDYKIFSREEQDAATVVVLPLTTKGDLLTYTNENARLPVGADEEMLVADSTTPTGLKWVPQVTGITQQQADDIVANNAKVSNVDHPLVETAVPVGAVFTDTVYDDTAIQAEVDLNTTDRHTHVNKSTLDKFGEDGEGMPTYNGNAIDTTIAQRDVYDGLDSTDNTVSLAASQGKILKDVQDAQQTAIGLNTAKVGITAQQAADIETNNAKVGVTNELNPDDIGVTVQGYDANITIQGNTFNGNEQLVKTTADGKLPALDGSLLTNISGGGGGSHTTQLDQLSDVVSATNTDKFVLVANGSTGFVSRALVSDDISDFDASVSANADVAANTAKVGVTNELSPSDIGVSVQGYDANTTIQGNTFNGNSQLVQTTADGKLPALDGSLLTNLPGGGGSYTFQDGLTESAGVVKLGGSLTEARTITGDFLLTLQGDLDAKDITAEGITKAKGRFIKQGSTEFDRKDLTILTGSSTLIINESTYFYLTLTEDVTINLVESGRSNEFILNLRQDATGGRTPTLTSSSTIKYTNTFTNNSTALEVSLYKVIYDNITDVFYVTTIYDSSSSSGGGAPALQLGDEHLGGIIFHLYPGTDGQQHGLIVSKTQSPSYVWQSAINTTGSWSSWDGADNHSTMINSPVRDWVDANFDSNWYVPAVDELMMIFNNRYIINKGISESGSGTGVSLTTYYWSSTEEAGNNQNAYMVYFLQGVAGQYLKTSGGATRAVRNF